MSASSVTPVPMLTDAGILLPAESAIVNGVGADFNAAFGGDLNLDPRTPQGQLIAAFAAALAAQNTLLAATFNGFDPARASGAAQDALGAIYGQKRIPATATVVTGVCRGLSGVSLPAGTLASAADGNIYAITTGGVIGSDGTVALPFACTVSGPITCPIGTLNRPYKAIPGWDSVINPAEGVAGSLVENRADFERRRAATVQRNARTPLAAIRAAVVEVAGVVDCATTQNTSETPMTWGALTLPAHSILVSVSGGADFSIAAAIFSKLTPGATMAGNVTILVPDTDGTSVPYPTYAITFQRAAPTRTYFAVTLASTAAQPEDAAAQVQAAIVAAFTGASSSDTKARIGGLLLASRFYAALAALGSWVEILSVFVGTSPSPTATSFTYGLDQAPTIAAADISVSFV